jgi:hypothetical protein
MTLDTITVLVTSTVGQQDATSQGICKDYIQRRYQTIADSHPWIDLQITATVTLSGGTSVISMPTNMERVTAARANGKFLDPVTSSFLIQTDPDIFERSGVPTLYEEYTDYTVSPTVKKIRFFPQPTVDTPIFIVGRRTVTALGVGSGAGSSSVIRGIDNALIAYATGDMLERQRQYAKAQAKFQEANALLEAAKALESQQSNQPRRSKGLTAAGNSLAEMADSVCARCGMWSLDDVILVKDLLKRNYQTVYDSTLWQESTAVALVQSDGEQLVLPAYFDRVISVRSDPKLAQLVPVDVGYIFGIAPAIFEETTGTQFGFSMLTPVAVAVVPPGLEKLDFVSSNSSDKSPIFIRGESQGDVLTEVLVLNGTTTVTTANNYDYPLTIAKQVTTGDITITGHTSTVQLQKLYANELERKHIRLWLHPANETNQDCLVFGKRKINPLLSDEDTPMLREVQNVLIEMTVADMMLKNGKSNDASVSAGKAEKSLERLIKLETNQGANQPRVIPSVEPSYCGYDSGYWVASKQ